MSIGPMSSQDPLVIAGRTFSSRLLLGTGKFPSSAVMGAAARAAGSEIVTVALRRVDLDAGEDDDILAALDTDEILILTNTSGAVDADEAVRLARLARAAGLPDWIKLEVTPDLRSCVPASLSVAQCNPLPRTLVPSAMGAAPGAAG